MQRVNVRVVGRAIRGKTEGDTIAVSRRDARLLVQMGRAEFVSAGDDAAPKRRPAPKKGTPVKATSTKKAAKPAAAKKASKPAKKAAKKAADYKRRDMRAD